MPRIEVDFQAFRQHGDTTALARVFDALAPELLILAAHVCRDEARAEDLVQETFLEAIESARHYQGKGRLRSWLAGILVRKAKMARRREARRPDPQRIDGTPEVDPSEEAEARELLESMSHALESLPTTYRQVLNLRLVHGFSPVEISRTLERPPATVHTQLRRGLELLRKAMPRGLALPAAFLLDGRGLAHVRQLILERAATATTAVTGMALFGGILVMKKWIALGVAALGALALWQWPPDARPLQAPAEHTAEGISALANETPQETPPKEAGATGPASAVDRTPIESAPPSDIVVIRGRCIAAETSQPLPGCRISILPSYGRSEAREHYERLNSDRPNETTSRNDGFFEIAMHPGPDFGLDLACRAEGRVVAGIGWHRLAGGEVLDLGDIPLPLGTRVRGRVADAENNPLSNIWLKFEQQTRPQAIGLLSPAGDSMLSTLKTEADGSFETRNPLAAGAWLLREATRSGAPFEILDQVSFHASEDKPQVDLDIRLAELEAPPGRPTVSGTVVDDTGQPVGNLSLRIQSTRTDRTLRTGSAGRTARDGRFSISLSDLVIGTPEADGPQWILPEAPYEPLSPEQSYSWGEGDIVVVLHKPEGTTIRVVDARSGKPVTRFGVVHHPVHEVYDLSDRNVKWTVQDDRGITLLETLPRGLNHLMIVPEDPDLAPSSPLVLDIGTTEEPLRIEVDSWLEVPVRVLSQRLPVQGSEVQLVHYEGQAPFTMRTQVLPPIHGTGGGPVEALGMILDSGTTDEEGMVMLRAPKWDEPLTLKLNGPGHLPVLHQGVVLEETTGTLTVEVPRGAVLRGTIQPLSLVERIGPNPEMLRTAEVHGSMGDSYLADWGAFPGILLSQKGKGRVFPPHRAGVVSHGIRVNDDGSFLADGVPPGTYDVYLNGDWWNETGGHASFTRTIGTVELQEGGVQDVSFDLSAWAPAKLTGQAFLDDEPFLGKIAITMTDLEPDQDGRLPISIMLGVETTSDGRFEAVVKPGTQNIALTLPNGGQIRCPDSVVVGAGSTADHVFRVSHKKLVLRVLTFMGDPVPERRFQVLDVGLANPLLQPMTDSEGRLELDPAPSALDQYRIVLGPIQMPAGEKEADVEVRLPEGIH